MEENRKLSHFSLEPHLLNLRVGGYFQIDQRSPKLHILVHNIYMRAILILILVYTTQQAIRVYEVREDMDKVMGTMFLFLTHTVSIYKQVVMWIKSDQVEELLDVMKGPLFNQGETDHRAPLLRTAQHSKMFVRVNNSMAVLTCFLWVLYPVILHLQGKQVEFAIWLPFDINENPQFYIAAVYVLIVTSLLAVCNTTIDVMVSFMFAQCETQLFILRDDLTKLVQRSKKEKLSTKGSYDEIINRRFRTMLLHHIAVVQFAKKVEDVFGFSVAYQFLASAWIICTSVYKMVQIDPLSVQYFSMVMYICCMLLEFFMYCFYGSEATHESNQLTYSAYGMNWLETPLKHRRHLVIFMERIKRPMEPMAGSIIPLSNNTFVSIVKSSYTFYALLKNTNE